MFEEINDEKELTQLIANLRLAGEDLSRARKLAKDIILRKRPRPEFVRSVQRQLYPRFTQMILEIRELVAEAKERREDVRQDSK
jgi:hypothetical protein